MKLVPQLLVVLFLLAAAGDGLPPAIGAAESGSRAPRGVPDLPNLSGFEPSVQAQVRYAHAALLEARARGVASPELAAAYGYVGELLFASDDAAGAEPFLLEAEALAGSDMRWPYYLGQLYRRRADLSSAAKWLDRARQLDPSDLPTLVWLGRIHVDAGQPAAAEEPLTAAVALAPRSAAALSAMGRVALARRDYSRAAAYFEDALAIQPGASALHYAAGMAYQGLSDKARAEAHLRQRGDVDALPPDHLMQQLEALLESPVRYHTLGLAALDNGRWADAEQSFRKGLSLQPADPGLRAALDHGLGTALAMSGDSAAAQALFEQGVQASPAYAKNHYSLGVLDVMAGRDASAVAHLTEAVKYEPGYAQAHLVLGDALRRSGRADAALVHYQEVLRIDARMAEARFGAVLALVRLNRFAEAAAIVNEGVTNHPDDPRFPHALARLLAAAPDMGIRDGRRALSIVETLAKGGVSVEFAETMAMALAEVGRYADAVMWQRRAISSASHQGATAMSRLMTANLDLYERGQPCRTPWRPDELAQSPRRALGRE